MVSDFTFEKIIPTDEQIVVLFELLNNREHRISHNGGVTFESHKAFVCDNPYRAWYIVKRGECSLGSFYVTTENTIGINLKDYENENAVLEILLFVKRMYKPLDAIPSVRRGRFAVNVPPTNHSLSKILSNLGAELAQVTYYLPK